MPKTLSKALRFISPAAIACYLALILTIAFGLAGYNYLKSQIAAELYRDRLITLQTDYETLRDQYNAAVRRTATTELVVKDGQIDVIIRQADGSRKTINTPFTSDRELYVDYVILDGRLWIRRVFDDLTPAKDGVLIDPRLGNIHWPEAPANPSEMGKAVYRKLTDGRWIITVTGDGSLGLRKHDATTDIELINSPTISEFKPTENKQPVDHLNITWADVVQRFFE